MANPYSGEWIKINTIANDVRALQDRIAELQNAAAQLQADINSVPEVTDEEGNDVNAEQRNALNAQLESVKASIDEANGQRERLGSQARALARQYQTEARAYEEKARHTSNATAVFNNISNYRFGARMASANAQVTKQREQHYQSYVNILNALVIAAQNAANGITPSGSEQSVADRGTFHNSHSTSGGAHKSGEKGNRQNYQRGWNGIPGESQKIADQNESKALLNNLGVEGIPYKNGQPDFSTVAHAAVPTDDSAALLTCADAMLAAKYGVSADEIAAYRKENGLEWRGNENGEATLIPQCIGDEYLEGRVENQEKSAKDALTAYMWAHNYGKDDYEVYSKDPEWQRLHSAAFPEEDLKNELNSFFGNNSFVPLLTTNQEITTITLDGKTVSVFDHPFDENPGRVCQQGSAFPKDENGNGITGTCGCCACGTIINKAGGNATEKSVVKYAIQNDLCSNRMDVAPESRGGTSPDDWVGILAGAGITATEKSDSTLEQLAEYVEQGHGVVVALSACTISPDWYGHYMPGVHDGHAVVIESIVRDPESNKILEYIISDSNGSSTYDACRRIPARRFKKACRRRRIQGRLQAVVTNEVIW